MAKDTNDSEMTEHEATKSAPSLIKVMRAKCLDCCVGQSGEVRKCHLTACALWPYRMGRNPYTKRKGHAANLRAGGNHPANDNHHPKVSDEAA